MFRYNSTGVKMEREFKAAPFGDYRLVIKDVSEEKDGIERLTKNGDKYVNVLCEIDDVGDWLGTKVYHNVVFLQPDKKGAGIAVHFLKTIDQPWEGEFDVIPKNWIGKTFRARLNNVVGQNGKQKNEIAFVYGQDEEEGTPF